MRRDFQLPEHDIDFLDGLELPWEAIKDRGMQWALIQDYPVPPGYNVEKVTVAIKIEPGYPRARLDMAYFYPHLFRKDGKQINALTQLQIDGKSFQRWSRHRTAANPWREGVDDLSTHLAMISYWFEQEFIKRPNGVTA